MPIYEFNCFSCTKVFEEFFYKFDDADEGVKCPGCSSNNVKRIISLFSSPGVTKHDSCGSCNSGSCDSCSK